MICFSWLKNWEIVFISYYQILLYNPYLLAKNLREHPCITHHKRGGGAIRKWQFLITFSTESNHKGKGGSENPKY